MLYAGQVPDASFLLETLLGKNEQKKLRDDIFHTNLVLVGHCLAARPRSISNTRLQEIITNRLFAVLNNTPHSLDRKQTSEVLVEIGGTTVNTQLVSLLSQEQVDSSVQRNIADALGTLADDTNTVYTLATLLKDSDIADNIYSALWYICRRMNVRVYITDEQDGQHIEVVPMEDALSQPG